MTAKTVSKTDSKYNVKLIAITAMWRLLLPLQLLYQDSVTAWILSCRRLYDLSRRKYSSRTFRNYRIINRRRSCRPHFGISALGNPNSYYQGCQRSSVCALQNGNEEAWQRWKNHQSVITSYAHSNNNRYNRRYFIANGLMYDFGAAIAELPTCWLQPGVGALIYIVVGIGLDKINFKKKLSL